MTSLVAVRAQLAWLCDAMIPADQKGALPSALQAGLPEVFVPRALALRDDWATVFIDALASLPAAAPAEPLAALRALPPMAQYVAGQIIAGAYLMNAEVRRVLRYPGQQALQENTDFDEIVAAAERVQARGPCFVATPERP